MRDEAAGPSRPADRGALPAVRSSHHGGDQTSSSAFATDPTRNVVLEASAGTGKTSVLVGRYLRLVRAGVDPSNILAITFTRKAAAEMRERIIGELRSDAARSEADRRRWAQLRDRLAEVSISTIDAFCLSLLREFPLEADLEPDFRVIDSTEVRRLVDFALDQALRAAGRLARTEPRVAMVMSQLPPSQLRRGLDHLLSRRMVAPAALDAFLARGAPPPAPEAACDRAVRRILAILDGGPGGLEGFLGDGPVGHPRFAMLADDLRRLGGAPRSDPGQMRSVIDRTREHFLTRTGEPRTRLIPYRKSHCRSPEAWRRHLERIKTSAAPIANSVDALDRDLNRSLVGGVRRIYGLVEAEYRRALDAHAALDFTDLLLRALDLLRQMDEFAQSRYRLESRYHHVLLDEFQDTSRAQWQLVSLLIQSWGEGFGLVHDAPLAPTVFVVGDRKQSIYRFRDAEVAVLREAADYIAALRPDGAVRESISRNFRAVGALLRFVNDVCAAMPTGVGRDAFRYEAADYFPEPEDEPTGPAAETGEGPTRDEPLGLVASTTVEACARATASEIARLLDRRTVRDRQDGTVRKLRPGDIAILFRSRESHVAYEEALQAAGIPVYVYKGLGFFDAPEVKDVCALVEFLADPGSDLRAAAFLRSRIVRLSDTGLQALAPRIAQAVRQPEDRVYARLGAEDRRVLTRTTAAVAEWLRLVDRITPAELVDHVLDESAYAFELRGHRRRQATENLKKLRGLIRRIQNRGYATMARIAEHIDHLAVGEEPNAVVEAFDAVNLMTVHAAKGLEFPVVFIVNLARGTGATVQPVRVVPDRGDGSPSVAVGPFVPQTDVDEHAREREESKRLFYVAATRAREALYLSTTVAGARLRPGRGSLAEVLPASLLAALERAAAGNVSAVDWVGSAGREHRFRVCHAGPPGASDAPTRSAEEPFGDRARDDFRRLTVVDPLSLHDADEGDGPLERPIADALLLDLLEDAAAHRSLDAQPLASRAQTLLRRRLGVGQDDQALVRRVVAAYQDVMRQPPLTALLGGACLFRVPFSAWRTPADGPPGLVRGTIACVARRARGVTVLDFRLVDPDPSHELRLEIQRQAASVLCAADADARLVYL